MLRQSEYPCSKCGSMYRNGDTCNICGSYEPVNESFYMQKGFSRAGKPPRGEGWDPVEHKVIRRH